MPTKLYSRHSVGLRLLLLRHFRQERFEMVESCLEEGVNGLLVVGNETLLHEAVLRILDQLSKCYHQTPRVGAIHLQTLKHYPNQIIKK